LEINVPFQHKYGYITDEWPGWRVIHTQYRKASDILTSTLAAFLFSSHPIREMGREAIFIITLAPQQEETTITPLD